jgi:Uma2 family endonuclease
MSLLYHPNMTVEEYFALDQNSTSGRYEYIDGHIRLLAGGTPDHSQIGTNFASVLYIKLESRRCRTFNSDVYVQLSETQYVHPDVSVSCDEPDRTQKKIIQHPCLIVEVLSPSTESYDRRRKLILYQTCPSVQEYVLVNTTAQWIEVFRRERTNFWRYLAFEYDEEVELASVGIHFPISMVYRDVDNLQEPLQEE